MWVRIRAGLQVPSSGALASGRDRSGISLSGFKRGASGLASGGPGRRIRRPGTGEVRAGSAAGWALLRSADEVVGADRLSAEAGSSWVASRFRKLVVATSGHLINSSPRSHDSAATQDAWPTGSSTGWKVVPERAIAGSACPLRQERPPQRGRHQPGGNPGLQRSRARQEAGRTEADVERASEPAWGCP